MRRRAVPNRALTLLSVAAMTIALLGCSRAIGGVAQPDLSQPGVALSEDGFGIIAGATDAPVQIDLFTEPQCSHCADLQFEFGDEIKAHVESGRLAVTYRPLTFLVDDTGIDYSAVVTNAMFLAADPATEAGPFQQFVQTLWANQNLAYGDYTDEDFARLARASGLSDHIVDNISAAKAAVDPYDVDSANGDLLYEAQGEGTPLVYDLNQQQIVDIGDADWLDKLMRTA